jgi:phenylalanyl-tRNA synthetase beta chain
MPICSIPRDALFEALGRTFTEDEFQELCFEFGIELDEVVTEELKGTNTRGLAGEAAGEEVVYKVEVPANRYDILCLEGMIRALGVFLGTMTPPTYRLSEPPSGTPLQMIVEPATAQIRPYVVCAVLRNCTFTERAYNSFLDLQDKFHHNICRRRTLVAIGTHDLSTLKPPFRYRALPPKEISFVPLAQAQEYDAETLFAMYGKSAAEGGDAARLCEPRPR